MIVNLLESLSGFLGFLAIFFISIVFSNFLFWRAGKHELVEAKVLFDTTVFSILGALVLGRILDFLVRVDYYNWSLVKLIFFNAFSGFNFFGAFLGLLLGALMYSKIKKAKFWELVDFGSQAIAFGIFIFNFLKFFLNWFLLDFTFSENLRTLFFAFLYFVIFWSLKKFETKKKHLGFFANFFFVSFSLVGVLDIYLFSGFTIKESQITLLLYLMVLTLSLFNWYILSKRKIFEDLKRLFAVFALSLFKFKRVLTNVREADSMAKNIVLSPLVLLKLAYSIVKYVSLEVFASVVDLGKAFGIKK